ncbi:hypothetical protein [Longimicrobium sp.]|jgi:hypothetical protein|uniref:hypothetical protein n=1 Tax=Longimicrobium sp. TaxID=2029185 RepID=UPI002F9513A4
MWLGHVPVHAFSTAPEEPCYVSPRESGDDGPSLVVLRTADGGAYRLRYADGIEFRVDARGTRVACTWPAGLTLEDAATYLMGSICGLVLRLRGIPSLHASAVALPGGAAAVCGPPQSGKSTTAAAFAGRGRALLSDDVVPLLDRADGVHVQPAYPHLRLWPDVLPALYGEGADLPPLSPNWEKRYLALDDAFHAAPLRLRAVYVLTGRETENAPRFAPVSAIDGLLELVANAYMGWFPDPQAQARELSVLAKVARSVPVVRVTPHADPRRAGELAAAIEADFTARTESVHG